MYQVAALHSRFADHYLKIAGDDGKIYDGGNQGWWTDKVTTGDDTVGRLFKDSYYRLVKIGCGTVAMSDAELYLTLQNSGYGLDVPTSFDGEFRRTGVCRIEAYRDYLEQMYAAKYAVNDVIAGLHPAAMQRGLGSFLKANNSAYGRVKWARYGRIAGVMRKQKILDEIERMLKEDIPVVFSYHSFLKKEIRLYTSLHNAKEHVKTEGDGRATSHYMTIIGLYRYPVGQQQDDRYILKVVSWGSVYYIDYEMYARKLDYFSNILSVY